MMRMAGTVAGLTAIYALALASADPWDLGIGAILALAVTFTFRRFLVDKAEPVPANAFRRLVSAPALFGATTLEIARGTIAVARTVLSPDGGADAGFVAIPIGEQTETGLAINGLLMTLSPGSVLVEIDPAEQTQLTHVLDASDVEAIRQDAKQFYDRYQRPVWP